MKHTIIIVFLVISTLISFSQTNEELLQLQNINQITLKKKHIYSHEHKNEVDFIFSNLFYFYKTYISPQDVSDCSFTPTCSEYAIMAIKQQGLIIGAINFSDRFTRCNGISQEYYEIDEKTKRLIDPVTNIKHEVIEIK